MLQLLQTWTPEGIEAALLRPDGPNLRRRIGIWIGELLPADKLVPDAYQQWRPVAHDSIEDTVRRFIEKIPLTRMPGIMDAVSLLDTLAMKGVGFPAGLLMFCKMLFTLDGVLRDGAGGEVSLDEMIAKYLGGRWLTEGRQFAIALDPGDWAAIWASISFYSTRLWLTQMSQTPRL